MKDYYKILQVASDASPEVIQMPVFVSALMEMAGVHMVQ